MRVEYKVNEYHPILTFGYSKFFQMTRTQSDMVIGLNIC